MQERRADEVLVLDGEAIWSRAIQETFNRLDKAVGSLLDGSRPACFPIEVVHELCAGRDRAWRDRRAGDKFKLKFCHRQI